MSPEQEPSHPGTRLIGQSTAPSIAIPEDALGRPGARTTLHVIPQFDPPRSADNEILGDRSTRKFVVSARFSKVPSALTTIKGDFTERDGSSYFVAPPNIPEIKLQTPWGECRVKKNDAGELSFAEFECEAKHNAQAKMMFIEAMFPALDHLSYAHNVALFVTMIRVFDSKNQSTHIEVMAPYRRQNIPNQKTVLFDEMKPVYAMYREAKNSESDFYRFLCFYKIMDGLLRRMRARVRAKAKSAGVELKIERDLVPDDELIDAELKRYVGMSIGSFFSDVLTEKFRDAVAHFTTSGDRVLHVSSAVELHSYGQVAFLCDLCVRILIGRHEMLLAQLH
jgi:hypothetical protein